MALYKKCVSLTISCSLLMSIWTCTFLFWKPVSYTKYNKGKHEMDNTGQIEKITYHHYYDFFADGEDSEEVMNLHDVKLEDLRMTDSIEDIHQDFYRVPFTELYIYKQSAFYIQGKYGVKFVIMTGLAGHADVERETFVCNFGYSDETNKQVKGSLSLMKITDYQKDFQLLPVLYFCMDKGSEYEPNRVAVSKNKIISKSTEKIPILNRLNHTKPALDGVAVCVKTMYNVTSPAWFAEWMEMQQMMGVRKVIVYGQKHTGPSVKRLINYYQKLGLLHIQSWIHNWSSSSHPKKGSPIHTQGQFVSNNDCLYRFGHQYRYLVYIDLDEMIVPSLGTNLKTYMDIIKYHNYDDEDVDTLYFKHTCFCTKGHVQQSDHSRLISQSMVYRQGIHENIRFEQKSIIKPSSIRLYGVHNPHKWIEDRNERYVNISTAKLHHYRFRPDQQCNIKDKSMLYYSVKLQQRVNHVLQQNKVHLI